MKFGGRNANYEADLYWDDKFYSVLEYIQKIKDGEINPNVDPDIIIDAFIFASKNEVQELLNLGVDPNLVNVNFVDDKGERNKLKKILKRHNKRKLYALRQSIKNLREDTEPILSITSEFLTGKSYGRRSRTKKSRRSRKSRNNKIIFVPRVVCPPIHYEIHKRPITPLNKYGDEIEIQLGSSRNNFINKLEKLQNEIKKLQNEKQEKQRKNIKIKHLEYPCGLVMWKCLYYCDKCDYKAGHALYGCPDIKWDANLLHHLKNHGANPGKKLYDYISNL